MNEQIKKDILVVLRDSTRALKKENLDILREQSDKVIHDSSIYQDKYTISVSVVVYTLVKILEKARIYNPMKVKKSRKV